VLDLDRAEGRTDDFGWNTIPMARAVGNGNWIVTNTAVTSFPIWSATPGAKLILGDFNRNRSFDLGLTGPAGWLSLPVAFSAGNGSFGVTNFGINQFATWAASPGVIAITQK
jgi:hypothetical protein